MQAALPFCLPTGRAATLGEAALSRQHEAPRGVGRALGQAEQEHILQHFLITRYLEDELRLLNALLDGASS